MLEKMWIGKNRLELERIGYTVLREIFCYNVLGEVGFGEKRF